MDREAIRKLINSSNRAERRKAERLCRISKILKPGAIFRTGNGKLNRVIMNSANLIYIRADEGKKPFKMSLQKIKK